MALGETIIVPVVSPASVTWLADLAARLALRDDGTVVPLSVAAPGADQRQLAVADAVVRQADEAARAAGARARGTVVHHRSVAAAVVETVEREGATLTLMGWQGMASHGRVFGELVDSIIGRTQVPLALVRHQEHPFDRVVLPISQDHLLPGGAPSLELAGDLAQRLGGEDSSGVMLLRTGETREPLPPRVLGLSDRVHHDPRRVDRAVAAAVREADLIVAPVAPTSGGLRAATTELAWAAPQAWLMVAVAGDPAGDDLAEAVRLAGTPPPVGEDDVAGRHEVVVTVGCREDGPTGVELVDVLAAAGAVTDVSSWSDRRGRSWRQAAVHVDAPSATAAVGAVMATVAETRALADAEIGYEVHRRRDRA